MPDTLEDLLQRLAALGEQALERWAAQQREEDDEFELSEDYVPWLTLEEGLDGWICGWRVQPDEASEWTIRADGRTPLAAAQALLTLMEARHG